MRGPQWTSPVLLSVLPVIEKSRFVRTNVDKIKAAASWMAYEEFPAPVGVQLFDLGNDPHRIIDHTMVVNILNFAFTDFSTGEKFETSYQGRTWSDSEAMVACMHRALSQGIPFLDGHYLSQITKQELSEIFSGSIEMPMLDERVECLHEVGSTLASRYDGKWHNFILDCSPKLFDDDNGVLERLDREFPRFHDVSNYHGHEVQIFKLAQLGLWTLHLNLAHTGFWSLGDVEKFTAFADYIVPVAFKVMGIFEYSDELQAKIENLRELPRDSDEEIEIRAHSLYAAALLTDELNALRPHMPQLVTPQVDFRLWKSYHATHHRHHLTKTTMY